MAVTIRQTKDGYLSECSCSEDQVGKGRCNHIGGDSPSYEFKKVSRGLYSVEVTLPAPKNESEAQNKIIDMLSKFGKVDPSLESRIREELNS